MSSDSRATPVSHASDTKECPFCAETIKARATVCRYCGRDLPSAAAAHAVALVPALTGQTPTTTTVPVMIGGSQVLDPLSHLVDKNLVVYEEDQEGHGRYRSLETVRQYVRERLLESGEGGAVRDRHRNGFLAFAEDAATQLTGPEQAHWYQRLEAEHENLRAALAWCQQTPKGGQAGLRLVAALWRFWYLRAYLGEGLAWCQAMLLRPDAQERTKERVTVLNGAGLLAGAQGDTAAERLYYEESLAISRELGDKQGMSLSLHHLGFLANDRGNHEAARSLLGESLAISRELGDRHGLALSLHHLGTVALNEGDEVEARAYFEECLALFQELGDRWGVSWSLDGLAGLAHLQGDCSAAHCFYKESLTIQRELGDRQGIAYSLEALGALAAVEGYPERGARLRATAQALREAIGAPLPPGGLEKDKREVAALRRALGEKAFAAAFAQGRAIRLEQTLAYALEETGDV